MPASMLSVWVLLDENPTEPPPSAMCICFIRTGSALTRRELVGNPSIVSTACRSYTVPSPTIVVMITAGPRTIEPRDIQARPGPWHVADRACIDAACSSRSRAVSAITFPPSTSIM